MSDMYIMVSYTYYYSVVIEIQRITDSLFYPTTLYRIESMDMDLSSNPFKEFHRLVKVDMRINYD